MDKQTSLLWKRVQVAEWQMHPPSSRWGHACCVIQNEIVIFGGYAGTSSII